jgi:hypothetical protein
VFSVDAPLFIYENYTLQVSTSESHLQVLRTHGKEDTGTTTQLNDISTLITTQGKCKCLVSSRVLNNSGLVGKPEGN